MWIRGNLLVKDSMEDQIVVDALLKKHLLFRKIDVQLSLVLPLESEDCTSAFPTSEGSEADLQG